MDEKRPVKEIEFVAVDLETTGLNSASDRIVELGAVRFLGSSVVASFDELVNPGIPISPDAARISGISDNDVREAPAVASVLPSFLQFLGDRVVLAHNAPFDLGFLRAAAHDAGLPPIGNPVIDTLRLAMKAFPRRKSYGLQNLAAELQIPTGTAHRARDDAELCMKLFLSCVNSLSFMGDLLLEEVLTAENR